MPCNNVEAYWWVCSYLNSKLRGFLRCCHRQWINSSLVFNLQWRVCGFHTAKSLWIFNENESRARQLIFKGSDKLLTVVPHKAFVHCLSFVCLWISFEIRNRWSGQLINGVTSDPNNAECYLTIHALAEWPFTTLQPSDAYANVCHRTEFTTT